MTKTTIAGWLHQAQQQEAFVRPFHGWLAQERDWHLEC